MADSIESLKKNYQKASGKEEVAETALELAKVYRYTNEDSAKHYIDIALAKTSNSEFSRLRTNIELTEIDILQQLGGSSLAMERIPKLLNAAARLNDDTLLASIYYLEAILHGNLARPDESLASYLQSLKISTSLNDTSAMGKVHTNMGNVFFNQDQYEEAQYHYELGQTFLGVAGDFNNQSIAIQNLALIETIIGSDDKANELFDKSINLSFKIERPEEAIFPLVNKASNLLDNGQVALAGTAVRKADSIAKTVSLQAYKLMAVTGMATYFAEINLQGSARRYMQQAQEIARSMEDFEQMVYTLGAAYDMEKRFGNADSALALLELYTEFQDSLRKQERSNQIQQLSIQYETEKKEAENELLKVREEKLSSRQNYLIIIFILCGIGLLAIIFIILRYSRKLTRSNQILTTRRELIHTQNQELNETNALLQESIQEKNALMSIVAHDLKAPLTKIQSLASLLEMFREDPEKHAWAISRINDVVKGGANLIRELVLVTSLEESDDAIEATSFHLIETIEGIVSGFQPAFEQKEIGLEWEVSGPETEVVMIREYLERILDNLISNALKFSHSHTAATVQLEVRAETFFIRIADQGPGIPEAEQDKIFVKFARLSNRPTGDESSTGLGLYIVHSLTQRLNGKIGFSSKVGQGTEFRIELPLKKA